MLPLENLSGSIPILKSSRLQLSPFQEADIPTRRMWMGDSGIYFLVTGRQLEEDKSDVNNWWECHRDNSYTTILAIKDSEGNYFGDIEFYVENKERRTCGLMVLIGARSIWTRATGFKPYNCCGAMCSKT